MDQVDVPDYYNTLDWEVWGDRVPELKVEFKSQSVSGGPDPLNVLVGKANLTDSLGRWGSETNDKNTVSFLSGMDGDNVTERTFTLVKGENFKVILANDPADPLKSKHTPQDAVSVGIGSYMENGKKKEIVVALIADGISTGKDEHGSVKFLEKSGKVADISVREGAKSVLRQLGETAQYSLQTMYSDILERVKKEKISHTEGATTLTLIVGFDHPRKEGMTKFHVHSLSSLHDNGNLYSTGSTEGEPYGGPVKIGLVPGGDPIRLAKYSQNDAYTIKDGSWIAWTTDGVKDLPGADDTSGIFIETIKKD